jgi:hypothetical protein
VQARVVTIRVLKGENISSQERNTTRNNYCELDGVDRDGVDSRVYVYATTSLPLKAWQELVLDPG